MTERAVVNASPLIYLSRADPLDLLRLAGHEIAIPEAVARELFARGEDDPAAAAIRETSWIEVVIDPAVPASILAWDLGPGESSVLSWALQRPGCLAVIDDLEGRRCAEAHGVRLRGTLGLVLRARQSGMI